MKVHRIIHISGKVQGVFFRVSTKQVADNLQLHGWVRNSADGKVEVYVTGEDETVAQFIYWCKQGPPSAVVKNVIVVNCASEEISGFEIRR